MARITLGPLASEATGRMGNLLFRRTRWGQVVQSMHPMPDAPSPATLDAQDRFRVAQRSWALMYADMHDAFLGYQRAHSLGSPGPWNGAVLDFLAGRAWDYPCVSHPSQHLTFTGLYATHATLTLFVIPAGDPVRIKAACFMFDYPTGAYVSHWWWPNISLGEKIYLDCPTPYANRYVIVIPTAQTDAGICGQGFAVAIPDKD